MNPPAPPTGEPQSNSNGPRATKLTKATKLTHPHPQGKPSITTGSDRRVAGLRALQAFGLSLSALTLSALALLSTSEGSRPAALVPGEAPQFSILIAGRDISYCYYRTPCKDQNQREGVIQTPNTDTLMVVKVAGPDVRVLSIPRDTNVGDFTWEKSIVEQKVNSQYWTGGPEALVSAVETITGERVDHYVIVRSDYVERVIDALGGLDVTVPESGIEWVDQAAGVNLKLAPGNHHLGGKEAVWYLRVRKGAGDDYGRIDHQKQALTQLAGKLKTARGLTALPTILSGIGNGVETNADPNLLVALQPYLSQMKLSFATLPTDTIRGTFNLAVNRERLAEIWGNDTTPSIPSTTLNTPTSGGADPNATTGPETPNQTNPQPQVKVSIHDASGANLGAALKKALTALGYAEVHVTTSPASPEASQVFTQADVKEANALASVLNLPRLQGERFPVLPGEVGILLGSDAREQLAALTPLTQLDPNTSTPTPAPENQ